MYGGIHYLSNLQGTLNVPNLDTMLKKVQDID